MKIKEQRLQTSSAQVSLYLDDIEAIARIIEGTGQKVEYSDKESEFDSLEELIAVRGTTPTSFTISGEDYVGITIKSFAFIGAIYVNPGFTGAGRAAAKEILELLGRRRTIIGRLLTSTVWRVPTILAPPIAALVALLSRDPANKDLHVVSFILIGTSYATVCLAVGMGFMSKVHLKYRHEAGSWLARNWREVVKDLLLVAVGAGLTKYLS